MLWNIDVFFANIQYPGQSLLDCKENRFIYFTHCERFDIIFYQQGQSLYSFSNRIIVKVPITKNGLEAIHLLVRQGIPTMATVVFHPRQALMAALAGANYVAPYLSRIEKIGQDPWSVLNTILTIFHNYRLQTKILAASLDSVEQVIKCAEAGVYGVTLKDDIFEKMMEDHPATVQGVHQFAEDWKKASPSTLFIS